MLYRMVGESEKVCTLLSLPDLEWKSSCQKVTTSLSTKAMSMRVTELRLHDNLILLSSLPNPYFSYQQPTILGPGGPRSFNSYGEADSSQQQDTIFVAGLPEDVTDIQLQEFFGAIGIIKIDKKTQRPKIWIYKDKITGRGKGEATVTYDDPPTTSSAIQWFNGKILFSVLRLQ